MNKDKQRLIIAKHCGWELLDLNMLEDSDRSVWCNTRTGKVVNGIRRGCMRRGLPNYVGDLNAMHEAEKTLGSKREYEEHLVNLCGENFAYSTAAQRAEAFLKTIRKWED